MRRQWCDNMNHRRDDAPVRFCPKCGEVVNANIIVKQCSVEEHAESRMRALWFAAYKVVRHLPPPFPFHLMGDDLACSIGYNGRV
jgi:hypothetical protein